MQKMNSNTTLVKVKCFSILSSIGFLSDSNTTLVKVKFGIEFAYEGEDKTFKYNTC